MILQKKGWIQHMVDKEDRSTKYSLIGGPNI